MKKYIYLFIVILTSCNKDITIPKPPVLTNTPPIEVVVNQPVKINLVYRLSSMDSISPINKTTSWYTTNKSFDTLIYKYFTPNSIGTKVYESGTTIYTDLTGDGVKDIWAFFRPPTNVNTDTLGLHFFKNGNNPYETKIGLVYVNKTIVTDVDNDGVKDVVFFSTGIDGQHDQGDINGIFYGKDNTYQYFKNDIGYFHSGTSGDIDNDGDIDILAYDENGSPVTNNRPMHIVLYRNMGNRNFKVEKVIFDQTAKINQTELFDMDNDGKLDLVTSDGLVVKYYTNPLVNFNSVTITNSIKNINDISFMDFNWDGKMDVITVNTVMKNGNIIDGFKLSVLINEGNIFTDKTNDYIIENPHDPDVHWMKRLRLFDFDKDGDIDIVGDGPTLNDGMIPKFYFWKNENGKFVYTTL